MWVIVPNHWSMRGSYSVFHELRTIQLFTFYFFPNNNLHETLKYETMNVNTVRSIIDFKVVPAMHASQINLLKEKSFLKNF